MPPKAKRKAQNDSDSEAFSDDSVEAPKKRVAKKAKKEKAPRAKSAYQYFVADRSAQLKEDQPDLKLAERSKVLGEMWRQLSDDEKQPFVEQSDADKASKKPAREAGKPKRPPTSYLIFTNAMRGQAKADNPDLKMTDLSKVMGTMWRELSDEEKRPYEEQAKAAKASYEKEVASFKAKKDEVEEEEEDVEEPAEAEADEPEADAADDDDDE
jgi:hypothetical protein